MDRRDCPAFHIIRARAQPSAASSARRGGGGPSRFVPRPSGIAPGSPVAPTRGPCRGGVLHHGAPPPPRLSSRLPPPVGVWGVGHRACWATAVATPTGSRWTTPARISRAHVVLDGRLGGVVDAVHIAAALGCHSHPGWQLHGEASRCREHGRCARWGGARRRTVGTVCAAAAADDHGRRPCAPYGQVRRSDDTVGGGQRRRRRRPPGIGRRGWRGRV